MTYSIKLSPPWITYCKKIAELFGRDPNVEVVYDEEEKEVKLFVNGEEKADAISRLLPETKNFGAVQLKITVVPSNVKQNSTTLFEKAFEDNPVMSFVAAVSGVFSNPITYVVFENKVVQFFNDDLGDINGNYTTLYEQIARDVFGDLDGVYFCTNEVEE